MDAQAYKKLIEGFKLIPPTHGHIDGTYTAINWHEDGRVLRVHHSRDGGVIRMNIRDLDGNIMTTWRERDGEILECTLAEYAYGWEPGI